MKKNILLFLLLASSFYINGCVFLGIATTAATGAAIVEERSLGGMVDDKVIYAKTKHEFTKEHIGTSYDSVKILVYEGRVLLFGYVKSLELKEKAEKLAWLTRGVKEVINDIGVQNVSNFPKDLWISAKLKTLLVTNKSLHSVNYDYSVYGGVIYLMGIARTQSEIDILIKLCGSVKGVKKVKNYIIVKDDIRRG
ncbi:MAG: osmotically-inducible protein OsmY [Candidatus Midichloriaceae bacterium]|jgi:osmotically-inducible protein OsmY